MNRPTLLRIIAYHWHKGLDSRDISKLIGVSEDAVIDALAEIRADKLKASRAA